MSQHNDRKPKVFMVTQCLDCGVEIDAPQDCHPRMEDGEPICTSCAVAERQQLATVQLHSTVGIIIADALGTVERIGGEA